MIGISKLYCGTIEPSDALRYGRRSGELPSHLLQFSADKKPVVVWNVTRACNLKCVHCYAHATKKSHEKELSKEEGIALIDAFQQAQTTTTARDIGDSKQNRGNEGLVHASLSAG